MKEPRTSSRDFRFECQEDCAACCKLPGRVYLGDADVKLLAERLGMSQGDVIQAFTIWHEGLLVLAHTADGCVFLDGTRCSVWGDHPRQCAVFPLWPRNLESQEAWDRAGETCPGIGKGPLLQIK